VKLAEAQNIAKSKPLTNFIGQIMNVDGPHERQGDKGPYMLSIFTARFGDQFSGVTVYHRDAKLEEQTQKNKQFKVGSNILVTARSLEAESVGAAITGQIELLET